MNIMRETVIMNQSINPVAVKARAELVRRQSALQAETERLQKLLVEHVASPPEDETGHLEDTSGEVISSLFQLGRASRRSAHIAYTPLPAHARSVGIIGRMSSWRVELHGLKGDPIGVELLGDVVLGRGPEADIDLDPFGAYDQAVSRRHALLRPACHHLYLLDLGSTNGTMFNTIPLARSAAHLLRNQDVISLGALTFTIRIVDGPAV